MEQELRRLELIIRALESKPLLYWNGHDNDKRDKIIKELEKLKEESQ